jgi:hypothetical protein
VDGIQKRLKPTASAIHPAFVSFVTFCRQGQWTEAKGYVDAQRPYAKRWSGGAKGAEKRWRGGADGW